MNGIRVIVFKRKNRKFYEAQWEDPITGKKRTRSTKQTTLRDAERTAAKLEEELLGGGSAIDPAKVTWKDFRTRYEKEYASQLGQRTLEKIATAFNSVEKQLAPAWLARVDADFISRYVGLLRKEQLSEGTIKSYLAHLRAAFNWAQRIGLMRAAPKIDIPKRADKSKGRAITEEEFDRMLAKTAGVVGSDHADAWKFLLRGLWFSGLRIGEALSLHWTSDEAIMADLSGKRPMFFVRAEAEKGRKNRHLPMAPEFAELLQRIPAKKRRGYVFKNLTTASRKTDGRIPMYAASSVIVEIGSSAGIKVAKQTRKRNKSPKFASAHDLRRAFGFRWAMRVLPPVLMELMRHESITTTMQYYVGRNAEAAADAAWRAFGESAHGSTNTFTDTSDSEGTLSSGQVD